MDVEPPHERARPTTSGDAVRRREHRRAVALHPGVRIQRIVIEQIARPGRQRHGVRLARIERRTLELHARRVESRREHAILTVRRILPMMRERRERIVFIGRAVIERHRPDRRLADRRTVRLDRPPRRERFINRRRTRRAPTGEAPWPSPRPIRRTGDRRARSTDCVSYCSKIEPCAITPHSPSDMWYMGTTDESGSHDVPEPVVLRLQRCETGLERRRDRGEREHSQELVGPRDSDVHTAVTLSANGLCGSATEPVKRVDFSRCQTTALPFAI